MLCSLLIFPERRSVWWLQILKIHCLELQTEDNDILWQCNQHLQHKTSTKPLHIYLLSWRRQAPKYFHLQDSLRFPHTMSTTATYTNIDSSVQSSCRRRSSRSSTGSSNSNHQVNVRSVDRFVEGVAHLFSHRTSFLEHQRSFLQPWKQAQQSNTRIFSFQKQDSPRINRLFSRHSWKSSCCRSRDRTISARRVRPIPELTTTTFLNSTRSSKESLSTTTRRRQSN